MRGRSVARMIKLFMLFTEASMINAIGLLSGGELACRVLSELVFIFVVDDRVFWFVLPRPESVFR